LAREGALVSVMGGVSRARAGGPIRGCGGGLPAAGPAAAQWDATGFGSPVCERCETGVAASV
jgi:hypothetical protein